MLQSKVAVQKLKGGDNMNTRKKLSDLDLPVQDYESTALSTVNGKNLIVKSVEFKKLGQYEGVVLTLAQPVEVDGVKWDKIHSSSTRIVEKFRTEQVRNALSEGVLEMTVISGKTGRGTWYDVE